MLDWLRQPHKRRTDIINTVSFSTSFDPAAIEKDWYVTLALKAVFQTPWANEIVFKGGTSLSKGWGLITRFSEDVDLAITPTAFGMDPGQITKPTHIKKLRKENGKFMEGAFLVELTKQIRSMGITEDMLEISIRPAKYSDEDPRLIQLSFPSLFAGDRYVKKKVDLEIGSRSLREPFSLKPITSIIDQRLPNLHTGLPVFEVPTVNPDRTFLEKLFLLHEELTKAPEKVRYVRMSRHLYDIYHVGASPFGQDALQNADLYDTIRRHRKLYNEHEHVHYDDLKLSHLQFIPDPQSIGNWEQDYNEMRTTMLGGDAPTFAQLMDKLVQLKQTIGE